MSGHTIANSITSIKPGWPFLILFVFLIFLILMNIMNWEKSFFSSDIKTFMKQRSAKENFFSIISKSDKVWFLSENEYLKKSYGIERVNKDVTQAIRKAKIGNKVISKTPFYDMLANQSYRNIFEYDSIINDKQNMVRLKEFRDHISKAGVNNIFSKLLPF